MTLLEDEEFLLVQQKKGRRGAMAGLDMKLNESVCCRRNPPKKSKKEDGNSKASGYSRAPKNNDDGSVYWDLGARKRITVRDFKGSTYVDIREFYEKDGKTLPGKKGISLKAGDWGLLKDMMDDIDHALRSR
ncbi:Transcriptional coactivator p15 (PC4) [Trinorchestia longiramus]|nr:Transcriptional coactivator p15 (PC4) [Trinorchestia longiramus]